MHLAEIDYISNNGESMLHRCRVFSKFILILCLLASLLLTNSLLKLSVLIAIIMMLFLISKVSFKKIVHLALYPVFFSLIFALIMSRQSLVLAGVIILRALGAGLSMLLLITTTPYVDVFSFLSLFMPSLLVDIFIFTYRSFFILIEKIESLMKSIKLKGGHKTLNICKNLNNIAGAIGVLIIHSFEMSERMYKVYTLRGYNGRIPLNVELFPLKAFDFAIISASIIILVGTVIPWSL